MSILSSPSTPRHFGILEPAPDESYLAELDPSWELLPQITGEGLTPEEFGTVVHRGRKVQRDYLAGEPTAGVLELERVERNGRRDALRAMLRKRPVAPCCDESEAVPCQGCLEPSDADERPADSWGYWGEPVAEPTLSLAELVDLEASRLRSRGNEAGDLMAVALAELARQIRTVDADRPDQVEERLSILDRDYSEPGYGSRITDADVLLLTGSVG